MMIVTQHVSISLALARAFIKYYYFSDFRLIVRP